MNQKFNDQENVFFLRECLSSLASWRLGGGFFLSLGLI
jgi:hypothetical protein